ncbi:hypothetical protein V6N11_051010 [Hibiscus sabdariffa]|uniref:Uncharacterized protein n=1 Tax=Hibiscus sabdariffa TaxID=183260 RepID=A0ABR2R310_9ROSI
MADPDACSEEEEAETNASVLAICRTSDGRRLSAAVKTDGSGPSWNIRDFISENGTERKREETETSILVMMDHRNHHRRKAIGVGTSDG